MLLLLPVIALVVVGVVLALGSLSREHPRRPGLGMLVPVGAVVAAAVVAVALGGLAGGARDEPVAQRQPSTTRPARPLPAVPTVGVDVSDPERVTTPTVVDGLATSGVIVVRARGFGTFEQGGVEVCAVRPGASPACADSFPVQFGENGRAEFQYLLRGAAAPGGCRAGRPTCLLRVTGAESGRAATAQFVMVDRHPRAETAVTPDSDLRDGQVVRVRVTGLAPGTRAVAAFCAPPGVADASRCAVPGAGFTVAADGTGSTSLATASGRDGGGRGPCGPRLGCAVVILSGDGFLASSPVPVRYSLGPGASYDAGRLAAGLLVALVLLAGAAALLRITDWAEPTEAATPELDGADLQTGADLDEIFGTDAELEAAYPGAGF